MTEIRLNRPFRVLYDLRWMELGKAGGVEQAAYELVDAIARIDRKNAYRILAPRSACIEWQLPPTFRANLLHSDRGEPDGERFHRFVAQWVAGAGAAAAARDGADAGMGFDLVHSTCSYINPELIGFPGVLTIQDLQHLHYPEFFSPAELEDREQLYRASARQARHIICCSEFTRRDVHARYGIPLDKLTTVWNIPSAAVWQRIPDRKSRALLAKMGIEGPFLFYPAHPWPHKNHARLVQAFARIAPQLPRGLGLVLTGGAFEPGHPAAALVRRHSLEGRVRHLGYRSPLEVRALFQECLALVFPSLFEGFGMPVAEAIIAGKPVVCANAASLPEICADAGLTFDPNDVDDMAARILEVATSVERREALAQAARRRRALFSASHSAIKTLAVYEQVIEGANGARAA